MPSLKLSVPSPLSQEDTEQRLRQFMEGVREQYGDKVSDLEDNWVGNVLHFGFTTKGVNIKGTMAVEPSAVKIDCQIPFTAMMFKGMIESQIRERVQQILGK